jgi:uncharacterized protein YkwD
MLAPIAVAVALANPLNLSDDEKGVLAETNAARKAEGLPPLRPHPTLLKMARDHSATMAKLNELGHDLAGETFGGRMKASGYDHSAAGENVGQGYDSPKAAVAGWLASPPHKANILSKTFAEFGVAVAKSADGTRYWTQVFAAPLGK